MSVLRPVWRLTLYQPKSQDPTETAPLVPAAGAGHSDAFKVATARIPGDTSGVWKPYLARPSGGRTSRVDPQTMKTDVGSMTAVVGDPKLADDEAVRWLTAFIGDDSGTDQLTNLRGQWEWSLDGGLTFETLWAGRTSEVRSQGRLAFQLPMRDEVDRLKVQCFVGMPHSAVSDAWQAPLLPIGRMTLLAEINAKGGLEAPQDTTYLSLTATAATGRYPQWFTLQFSGAVGQRWSMTAELERRSSETQRSPADINRFYGYDRGALQLEVTSGGSVIGRYWVRGITTQRRYDVQRVEKIAVEELDASDSHYLAFPALSTVYGGALVTPRAAGVSEASPLFVGAPFPINVVTLIGHLLDGHFGELDPATGDPLHPIRRRDFSALASVVTDEFRDAITEASTVGEWLTEHLLEPYDLALVPDSEGYLDLINLRRPTGTLTGLPSVVDADIVAERDAESWRQYPKDLVNAVRVSARLWQIAELADVLEAAQDNHGIADPPPGLVTITDFPPQLFLYADRGETSRAFDHGLEVHETTLHGIAPRQAIARGQAHAIDLFARFGTGATYVTYTRRRFVDDEVAIGDRRTLLTSGVPEASTHQRGINRVGMCVEAQEQPGSLTQVYLDEGLNVQAAVPDLGDLIPADGVVVAAYIDPAHAVILDTPATNAAGDPVRVDIAATADGASQPAEGSSLWRTYSYPGYRPDGLIMLFITNQPSGMRIWVRGRSEPVSGSALFPSAWVFPVPTSLLLDSLTGPTGLAVSAIGPTDAQLDWTVADTDLPIRVYVGAVLVDELPPGSTSYHLTGVVPGAGLTPNTAYTVSVVGVDGAGGETLASTAGFTTLASGSALPRAAGLQVLVPSAITLALFAADTALPFVIERAPDSTGAPDTGSSVTIADGIPGTTERFTDPQPLDGAVWWYRLAHGSGAAIGPWTEWVSAVARAGTEPDRGYVRPTVDTDSSEAGGTGTLALTITDPQLRVTLVEFRTRAGAGAWSGWASDTAPYSAGVAVASGATSQIGWRVTGYDETGTVVVLVSGVETFGSQAPGTDSTFVTAADETGTLPNSRQLVDGDGTAVDLATPGAIAVGIPDGGLGIAKLTTTGTPSGSTYLDGTGAWSAPAGGGGGSTTLNVNATPGALLRAVGDSVEVPIDDAYTIVEAEIIGAASGNAVVDVLRATDAGFPTFASIAASAKPTLTAAQRAVNSTLTGWTTALAAGDTLRFTWESGDVTDVVVALKLTKSADVAVSAPRIITIVRTFTVAGEQADIPIDDDATVLEAEIQGDASGSAVVEVSRATDAGFPTFARIDGSSVPTLASQQRVKDATLTGWTPNLSAGDTLRYKLASFSGGISRVTMALKVRVGAVTGVGGFGGSLTTGTLPEAGGSQTLVDSPVVNATDNVEVGKSLKLSYGLVHAPTVTAVDVNLTVAHYLVIVTANATVNLPAAASSTGRAYQIVPTAGVTATVDPNGAELIDGAATLALTAGALIACDGTGWHSVAKAAGGGGSAPTVTAELLTNAGFETGDLTGWTLESGYTTGGVYTTGDQGTDASALPRTGSYLLSPNNGAETRYSQTIDVSAYATAIDAGNAHALAVAFFMNSDAAVEINSVHLRFLNGSSVEIGGWMSREISAAPIYAWQGVSDAVWLPPLTRSVKYIFSCRRLSGTQNNSNVDDCSLLLRY